MKLWIGEEQEGKLKGLFTLFVGSPVVNLNDLEEAALHNHFDQIYFGAGRCSIINQDVVRAALDNFPLCTIMLELDIEDISKIHKNIINDKRVQLIISVTNNKFKELKKIEPTRVQLKIQALTDDKDMYISLCQLELFDVVNDKELKGKKYIGDKVILK